MLVSYKTAQPQKLPVDLEGKTEAELNDLGFVVCGPKPEVLPGQTLWWENNGWVVRDPGEAELALERTRVQNTVVERLFASDYKVIKAYEQGILPDPEWVTYRNSLRDIYNTVDTVDPFSIVIPVRPSSVDDPNTEE